MDTIQTVMEDSVGNQPAIPVHVAPCVLSEGDTVSGDKVVEDDDEIEVDQGSSKKTKAVTSDCWRFFTKIGICNDGKERAKCNRCGKKYVIGGKKYGTSHLKRHLVKCTKKQNEDVGQMILDMQGKLKAKKIDQMVSRELLAKLILRHNLSYKFVEYPELRDWISYLCPEAILITRNTAKADINKLYAKEKIALKNLISTIPGRFCLTSDLWTSINTEGFITLTAHFVDLNWKLNSKLLNFRHMPPPHTGFELSKIINEFFNDWGLEKKNFSITLDNSTANDVLQKTLKSQLALQNGLLCDGEFFHVRCCAHILNLIVQDGLKTLDEVLKQIRMSIKYVKGSESRMIKFKQCLKKFSDIDASCGLCLDVPTRWNSTYLMLQSAIKYQRVFGSLHLVDDNYQYCPTEVEWKRAEKICKFLLPFYEITTLISATSYPTSNLYFLQVWKIQCLLIERVKDEDESIRKMAEKMMEKFDKYWDEYSVVLAISAVLDPRIKLEVLGTCFEMIDPLTWEVKLEDIKNKLYKLFSQYTSNDSISNVRKRKASDISSSTSTTPGLFDELKVRRRQAAFKTGKSQLDVYLDEPPLDLNFTDQIDVLDWWKGNSQRFSNLSLMARDLLSIPITTVASESAFSIGSRILNKYRNRLLPENVEAIICTSSWMNGFVEDDLDDDRGGKDEGNACSSKEASNVIPTMEDDVM